MGRKRKELDISLILKLQSEGWPSRRIAERLGDISYRTIIRILGQNKSTSLGQNNYVVGQNPGTKSGILGHNSSDVKNVVGQNNGVSPRFFLV
jgi:hypothetical protein